MDVGGDGVYRSGSGVRVGRGQGHARGWIDIGAVWFGRCGMACCRPANLSST